MEREGRHNEEGLQVDGDRARQSSVCGIGTAEQQQLGKGWAGLDGVALTERSKSGQGTGASVNLTPSPGQNPQT